MRTRKKSSTNQANLIISKDSTTGKSRILEDLPDDVLIDLWTFAVRRDIPDLYEAIEDEKLERLGKFSKYEQD